MKDETMEFEDLPGDCEDRNGPICTHDPDNPHRCVVELCPRNNLSLEERADMLKQREGGR